MVTGKTRGKYVHLASAVKVLHVYVLNSVHE